MATATTKRASTKNAKNGSSKEKDTNGKKHPAHPKVRQTKLLIDGKWVNAASGKTFETTEPVHRRSDRPRSRGRQGRRR